MNTSQLESFFEKPQAVAARVTRGWLPFVRSKVPAACFGYAVRDQQLGGELLRAGDAIAPESGFEAWVFRSGPWELDVRLEDLRSPEGLEFFLGLAIRVELEPRPVDVKLFLGFPELPDRVTARDVALRLEPGLRDAFGRRVEALSVEEASRGLDARRARDLLREAGEELFFERGLKVREVRSVRVESESFEELRRASALTRIEEERAKQRLRRVELWKREQLEKERARREVAAARSSDASSAVAAEPLAVASREAEAGMLAPSRLFACGGKEVYELRPAGDERPRRFISFADGDLGYLRSVRVFRPAESVPVLLAGAQHGVYVVELAGDGSGAAERGPEILRFSEPVTGGGGTNAAVTSAGRVFATHSEVGLVAWSRARPEQPQVIFDAAAEGSSGARAVQSGADGAGYFAAGDAVLSFELDASGRILERWEGAGSEVTALAAGYGEVVAGTRDGRLLLWDRPGEPPTVVARLGEHPIGAVRPVFLGGALHYAVASRSFGLAVFQPSAAGDLVYRAPRPVRWAAASGEFLFGADRAERILYIWSWENRQEPLRAVPFPRRIRDLWVDGMGC